jgi:hypothetical protein
MDLKEKELHQKIKDVETKLSNAKLFRYPCNFF